MGTLIRCPRVVTVLVSIGPMPVMCPIHFNLSPETCFICAKNGIVICLSKELIPQPQFFHSFMFFTLVSFCL